jgi:hypothetical protein
MPKGEEDNSPKKEMKYYNINFSNKDIPVEIINNKDSNENKEKKEISIFDIENLLSNLICIKRNEIINKSDIIINESKDYNKSNENNNSEKENINNNKNKFKNLLVFWDKEEINLIKINYLILANSSEKFLKNQILIKIIVYSNKDKNTKEEIINFIDQVNTNKDFDGEITLNTVKDYFNSIRGKFKFKK